MARGVGALSGHHALQHVEGQLVCLVGETRSAAASVRGHRTCWPHHRRAAGPCSDALRTSGRPCREHGSLRQQRSRHPVAGRPGHRRAGVKAGQQRAGAGNCAPGHGSSPASPLSRTSGILPVTGPSMFTYVFADALVEGRHTEHHGRLLLHGGH